MARKFTSFLILALLVVHLAGFYAYFVVRLGEVRMEMRKKLADLPDENLEVVMVPRQAFRSSWLEEREMKWMGKMYDIARVVDAGESVRVYCLHDEKEDDLLNFISAVVETSRHDTRQAPTSLVQFFTLEYMASQMLIPQPPELRSLSITTGYRESLIPFSPDPISPPPRT